MSDLLDFPEILPEAEISTPVDPATVSVVEVVDRAEITNGKPLVSYSRTEAALADLRSRFAGAVFDLTTMAGDKAARAARLELVTLRTTLEKRRKDFKAPALEFGKLIDSEAARITAQIVALETPIDAAIKADEARREAIRAEAARIAAEKAAEEARIEAERKQRLDDGVATLAGYVTKAHGKSAADLAKGLAFVQKIVIDPAHWAEYTERAQDTLAATLLTLGEMLAAQQAREAETERLEAQRVEQERIAAEQAEAQRKLDEQAAELKRQAEELAAAERARQEAEAKAAAEAAAKIEAEEAAKRAAEAEAAQVIAAAQAVRETTEVELANPTIAVDLDPVTITPTEPEEPATVRLGAICNALGFQISADFVKTNLGIECKRAGAAALYTEAQRVDILRGLAKHCEALI